VNNVLVETDVPHPTCLYPGAKEHFDTVLGHLSPTSVAGAAGQRAELYQIPVGVKRG